MEPVAWWLGWVVAAAGAAILTGWIADLPLLRSLLPHQVEAKANTAIGFLAGGVALVLKARGMAAPRWAPVLADLAAGLALLVGLLTLGEYATGRDFGIDQMLFTEPAGAVDTVYPGRMAIPTAFSFAASGLALLLLGTRAQSGAVWLSVPPALFAGLAFLGHLFDARELAAFGPFTPMAAPAGLAFLLLVAGIVLRAGGGVAAWWRRSAHSAGLVLALLLLALMGLAAVRSMQAQLREARRVVHTHEVLEQLAEINVLLLQAESGARGYLLTGDEAFLVASRDITQAARDLIERVGRLIADNPVQSRRLRELAPLLEARIAVAGRVISLRRQADITGVETLLGEGRRLMEEIRRQVKVMTDQERQLLVDRQQRVETAVQRTILTLGLGLMIVVGTLVSVFTLLRREIARRAASEAALRRSEQNLAVTLASIGDAVLATDQAGRVTLLNPVAERLTGWTSAEARGRPVAEVFRIINEQTREPAPIPIAEVLATGEIKGLANHTALIARDGTERSVEDSAAPIRDAAGRLLGVVLIFRDVTEVRRAQAQLDRFFELSLDFLCIASQDGYFKRASPAVTDILGWTVEEFLAMPYLEQIHPEDRASAQREVERQAAGQKVMNYECRFRHKDGSWRILAWRSVPHQGLMYATARDVTEVRRQEARIRALNAELQQRATQLEAANRELEAFSYSVSHDLRAPLRHVQGYVELLTREAQDRLSEKAQRYLRTISDAAREMGRLIDDLLAFSRMGRAEMTETAVELAPLVEEVRESLMAEAAGRDIRWQIGPLPRVCADAAMLRLVLVNLLGNAVKYTRRRPVAEITVGQQGEEDGRLVLYVRDNGAGFDMKYADKLFGVFQRLHRADEFEGTGIGLATVRRIIARHGGRTWAEAQPEAGATFWFTLRAAPAAPNPPLP
jgi:PAS domain S-box-containing protein